MGGECPLLPACVLQLVQCLLHIPLGDEFGPCLLCPDLGLVILLLGDQAVADLQRYKEEGEEEQEEGGRFVLCLEEKMMVHR